MCRGAVTLHMVFPIGGGEKTADCSNTGTAGPLAKAPLHTDLQSCWAGTHTTMLRRPISGKGGSSRCQPEETCRCLH